MRCLPPLTTTPDPNNNPLLERRRARMNSAPTKHATTPTGTTKKTKLPDVRTAQHVSDAVFTETFAPHRAKCNTFALVRKIFDENANCKPRHTTTYKIDFQNPKCKTLWRSGSKRFCAAGAKRAAQKSVQNHRAKLTAKTSVDAPTSNGIALPLRRWKTATLRPKMRTIPWGEFCAPCSTSGIDRFADDLTPRTFKFMARTPVRLSSFARHAPSTATTPHPLKLSLNPTDTLVPSPEPPTPWVYSTN